MSSQYRDLARREFSVTERIDYQAERYSFTEATECSRLTGQQADVIAECRGMKMGPQERLRIALLNVDYVTSFELPFRLLLLRTPQLIASVREELQLSQKNVIFNGRRFGCAYSLKASLSGILDESQYRLSYRIRRISPASSSEAPYQQIAKTVKAPHECLKPALESDLDVAALDGLFWFGSQRIVADVLRLRKAGMRIATKRTIVSDNLTATVRNVSFYRLVKGRTDW